MLAPHSLLGPSSDTYTYNDESGHPQTYTVSYSSFTQETNFSCSGVSELGPNSVYLPSSISTPAGGSYGITYENTPGGGGKTGRIAKITLPTGGYVSYSYTGGSHGINCTSAVVPTLTRKVYDSQSGTTSTWIYANGNTSATPGNFTVTETDPLGDTISYAFAGGYATKTTVTDVSLGLLSTTVTCYNTNFTSCAAPTSVPTSPITQTDVFSALNSSSSSLIETTYDCKATPSACYGLVTEAKTYNSQAAGVAPTGSPVMDRKIAYGTYSGGSCVPVTNTNVHNAVCEDQYFPNGGSSLGKETIFSRNANGHATHTDYWVSGTNFLSSYASYNTAR
jgi:hypothetical protein